MQTLVVTLGTMRISAHKGLLAQKLYQSFRESGRYAHWRSQKRWQSKNTDGTKRSQSNVAKEDATISTNPEHSPFNGWLKSRLRSILLKPRTLPVPRWISPRHFTITLSEVCGHSSFILVAISYAVDDYMQLRIIAVAGSAVMLMFTYFHPHGRVLWLPFRWNALFIAINSYRIGRKLADQFFGEKITPELKRIRDDHFYVLDPPDFARLVRLASVENYHEGDVVVDQGGMNSSVRLVIDGELAVLRDNVQTYRLEEGNFLSECGMHAGLLLRGRVESCCRIVATKETRTLCWDRNNLVDLLQREKSFRRALKAVLSWDIVRKLKGQRYLLASGEIDDPEQWTIKRNDQNNHRYKAILQNILHHQRCLRGRKEELENYRIIHHIDDAHHAAALRACGWTKEEFDQGYKEGNTSPAEEDDLKRDLRWVVHDVYMRLFG